MADYLDWQEGNPWFERLREKLEITHGEEAFNLSRHRHYTLGTKLTLSLYFSIKAEVFYEDFRDRDNVWGAKFSARFSLPVLR